ncbi:hypothetical protein D1AOALGA4SA_2373 [Olavius algarvensis Delta 1 endosymbiont]|nr:hypothetical protein D1AOALGA4SA_2373 [Olavius algarvensis Delta 1 endosymbiont]
MLKELRLPGQSEKIHETATDRARLQVNQGQNSSQCNKMSKS